jgi:hypothetical protein
VRASTFIPEPLEKFVLAGSSSENSEMCRQGNRGSFLQTRSHNASRVGSQTFNPDVEGSR